MDAPIEPEHLGPGGEHVLEQVVAADAEVDARRLGMQRPQLLEHRPRMWQYEPLVVDGTERARP